MKIVVAVGLRPTMSTTDPPQLIITAARVHMENLDLLVEESSYAMIVNAISYVFSAALKAYACDKIMKRIESELGTTLELLNSVLATLSPIANKLGWRLPLPDPPKPKGFTRLMSQLELLPLRPNDQRMQYVWNPATTLEEVLRREEDLKRFDSSGSGLPNSGVLQEIELPNPGGTFAVRS